EEDVADHAGIVAVIGNQHPPESADGRMRVGEDVDRAVLPDSLANAGRQLVAQRPFDEIAGEISDQRFRRRAGKEKMREVVHPRLRYSRTCSSDTTASPSLSSEWSSAFLCGCCLLPFNSSMSSGLCSSSSASRRRVSRRNIAARCRWTFITCRIRTACRE